MSETLCWDCKKAAMGKSSECPWASRFVPVDGWKAKETVKSYRERHVESYLVRECPLFEREEARKAEAPETAYKRKQRKPKHIEEATDDISRIKIEVENELVGMRGAERTKARRAALKRRGVCVTCMAEFAANGYASCAKCLNYFAERRKERREQP